MDKYKIRNLTKNEIECRIGKITEKGLTILLYKTARTDIKILNETFGQMNWQCEYKEIKNNIYCGISIFDDSKKEWITKWDCGTESDFGDKEKAEASDAFKRAGFKWGIGLELYTSPFIFISKTNCNISNNKCYDKFTIEKIQTQDKIITGISILNTSKDNIRAFVWAKNNMKG